MKRGISFILVMLMVLCMVPSVALAADYVAQIGTVGYESIQAAVEAAQDGETIKLLSNVDLTEANRAASAPYNVLIYVNNKNITLDMNGKTISLTHQDEFTNPGYIVSVICIEDNAGLTVTGNGKIDVDAHDTNPDIAYIFFKRGSTGYLTIENGIYHMNNSADSMVYTHGSDIVTVNGGTFTIDEIDTRANGSPWIFNVQGQNHGHVNVNGGTFNDEINNQFWIFEAQMPANKALIDNGDGTWTVVDAVAWVNVQKESGKWYTYEKGFATLEEAIAEANKNTSNIGDDPGEVTNTVTLLQDCVVEDTLKIDADMTIELNGYNLIWEGDDTAPIFTVDVEKSLTVEDFTPIREEYIFKGWYTDKERTDSNSYDLESKGEVVGGTSLYAKWKEDVYTVTAVASPSDAGTVTGGGTFDKGTEVTLTANPKDGFFFDGWVDESGAPVSNNNPYIISKLDKDYNLVALFAPEAAVDHTVIYTVTFDPGEGTGTKYSVEVTDKEDDGETYKLPECTFTAPAGKQFKAWSVDGEEKAAGAEIIVNTSMTITAVWEDVEPEKPTKHSHGSHITVKYEGGNRFSTNKSAVPTSVEIDGVPVSFVGDGRSFTVSCIEPGTHWITVRWHSTSVTTNFTADASVVCIPNAIPKTGDMPIWAAIAEFLGF